MKESKGFSAIEILVALTILASCVLLALPALKIALSNRAQMQEEESAKTAASTAYATLRAGINKAQVYYAAKSIRIQCQYGQRNCELWPS